MLKKIIILISSALPALAMEDYRSSFGHNETGNEAVYLNAHTSFSSNNPPFFLPLLDTALNFDGITLSQNGNPYVGTYPSAYNLQGEGQFLPHPFYDPLHSFWKGTLFSKNTSHDAQDIFGSSTSKFNVDAFLDYAVEGGPFEEGDDSQDSINMINALSLACNHTTQEYLMPDLSPIPSSQSPSISMPPSTLLIDLLTKEQ